MIPVYEEYKDKGFTILGVAREMNNSENMEKAIEKYKFTWLNLIELDDQNKIWRKYDIPFSGGGTFLIAEDGDIVAIDPTAEEVRDYLSNLLN